MDDEADVIIRIIFFAFAAFLLVIGAIFVHQLGQESTRPSDSFRSVCAVQGGTPYVGTDKVDHYPAICVKGGVPISVPVVSQ